MAREQVPQGWKSRLNEWKYKYDTGKKIAVRYQSTVSYNKNNGLSMFNIVGSSENPVIENEHLIKRAMISKLRKIINIDKYIMIISQNAYKGKGSFCIIVQLHCFLKQLPTNEQLVKIKEVLTDYEYE